MCVIMIAKTVRPTEQMIEQAWKTNSDGAGIAHGEGDYVVWEKGIEELPRIIELCANLPLPYIAHFRVASVGGIKPSLTHPFLVSHDVPLDLKGRTKGSVLFHNGHWNAWNDRALEAAIHSNSKVPEGSDWSDSRAIAWMIHIYGPGFMELLPNQKGVLMSPKKLNVFTAGNGWEKINDVWCSNDYFWHSKGFRNVGGSHSVRWCSIGRCNGMAQAGKDICEKCESERKLKAANAKNNSNVDDDSVGQSQLAIVTGGESKGPLAKFLTMAEVESYHKANLISKSKLKKYRKAYSEMTEKGNKGARALKQLLDLSVNIAERLMTDCGSWD